MNTPAHLIFGAAAFARPGDARVTAAAIAGALIPDVSLYLMSINALYIQGISHRVVFGEMYFSDAWMRVFAVDHSFFLWAGLLVLGLALRRRWVIALGGAGLLHVLTDLPLHHDDARPHFEPLTDWVFRSPLSYWDVTYHAALIAPLEGLVSLLLCAVLWRRFNGWPARTAILFIATLEMFPTLLWRFVL